MVVIIRKKNVLDVTWEWYSLDLLTLVFPFSGDDGRFS